jgi:hypothetical protein
VNFALEFILQAANGFYFRLRKVAWIFREEQGQIIFGLGKALGDLRFLSVMVFFYFLVQLGGSLYGFFLV